MDASKMKPDYTTENYQMPVEEALKLAREHHLVGNFIIAERTYYDILNSFPENPTANHLLGALYFQIGSTDKALHYMEESIRIAPDEVAYLSNYGSALNIAGRYDDAITTFNRILELSPDNLDALARKASTEWQMGQHIQAEQTARKLLELAPDSIDGMTNLALALTKQKKYDAAHKVWIKASETHPDEWIIWSNWANMLREAGKLKHAKEAIDKAIALAPKNVDVLNNAGCILRDLGEYDKAIKTLREATNISPKYYQAHYNLALAYSDSGNYNDAAIAAHYAVDFNPEYIDGYNALCSSLIELGEFNRAHYAAQRAVQIDPENTEALVNLAEVLYLSNKFDDGHAALKLALAREPDNASAFLKLCNIYERLDEAELALDAINKAIELEPERAVFLTRKASLLHIMNRIDEALEAIDQAIKHTPSFLLNLISKAEILIAVNRLDEAQEIIEDVIKRNPDYPHAYFTLAELKRFESENDPNFQKLLSFRNHEKKMSTAAASSMYFTIGNAYEKMKQYDKAFENYDTANAIRRRSLAYDVEKTIAGYTSIREDFTPELFELAKGLGCESDSPIFIVGVPRSGTTLTEQIISSHPDVFGAGELSDLSRIRRKYDSITPENIKEFGELYVESSRAYIKGGEFKHVSDKMPGNFKAIGCIAAALPNAKIIHCRRNPIDTCLSNYKQNFLTGQFWSYNLEEMADEYQRYLDLMAYWDEVLPGKVFHINYEDTVSDLETQARALIDHIGLEWNDACLAPHKQERAIITASKMQVTKPVYTSSIQKWKRFEKQLQPLVRKLLPEEAL